MANYIGNIPSQGEFKKLDSIASSFDGNETQFNLNYNSVSQPVGDASQLIVSLNGVIQEPLTSYTLGIGGSTIVFSSAPQSGDTCHIVLIGGVGGTATPSDNSVTAEKIASTDDFTFGSITVTGSGSIDGRDISADGTKLDGIEASADVTDTANVTAAGALMDSELTDEASVKALDQGVATTDAVTFAGVSTDEFDLSAIDTTINDTAVDIFIYDTSKDSDGGAWRKRTQHTSWYNETLNTSTRGSRREFPAVAVIVAETGSVTIYDGDDPDLPMWMVFTGGTGGMASRLMVQTNGDISCVAMLNGILIPGRSNDPASYGIPIINFISEKVVRMDSQADAGEGGTYTGNIATRNDNTYGYVATSEDYDIISSGINDVAMTVLPNAPIDSATGLPIPTIAVATDGGVSVIKDDGTVVDLIRNTSAMQQVTFQGTRLHINSSSVGGHWIYDTIPNGDETLAPADGHFEYWDPNYSNVNNPAYLGWKRPSIAANYIGTDSDGSVSGITAFDYVSSDSELSMMAWITSSYNTGWMHGDIKLATLSDTDDTDVTGPSVLTNYDLSAGDLSGWTLTTADSNGGIYANQDPVYVATNLVGIGNTGSVRQNITVETGKKYIVGYFCSRRSQSAYRLGIYFSHVGGSITFDESVNAGETKLYYWTSDYTGTTTLQFRGRGGGDGEFSNFIFDEVEEDRSVNSKGLQVFGTVTKNHVATGADLVAYSGFSANNYLLQPYNSDLDFTADFNYTFWYYHIDVSTNEYIAFRAPIDNGTPKVEIYVNPGNQIGCYINDMGGINFNGLPENAWHHISVVRDSGTVRLYVNGDQKVTGSSSADLTNTSAILSIGKRTAGAYNGINGKLALFRASATAPSAEQIKKIYEDEKFLFQENAQATLYGSSDAVTALAYDDDTELLHAGTSAGRSVFQGLRRVENTTDAVSTAISVNNGMVAEQ